MCTAIPDHQRNILQRLRATRNAQGASDSKHYWVYAAKKLGMVDTDQGIQITDESKAAGLLLPPFGSLQPSSAAGVAPKPTVLLAEPGDVSKTSAFLYVLVLQTELVHLQPSEQVAKRKTLPVGLEGIGCRYCCAAGRYGFSRRFPLRKRCLPEELNDMYCHIKRCPLCPEGIKQTLATLYEQHKSSLIVGAGGGGGGGGAGGAATSKEGRVKDVHREFYDLLWARLGRTSDIKT